MKSLERWILGACFVVTGATGLILQVAWSKELSYILGSTLYGSATVVAAFMAGLGIGSAVAGRFAERLTRPVRTYAFIQFGIAACGAISIPVFRAAEPVFRFLFQTFTPGQSAFLLARFAIVFLLIVAPVTLMGMTLPTDHWRIRAAEEKIRLRRWLDLRREHVGCNVGHVVGGLLHASIFRTMEDLPYCGIHRCRCRRRRFLIDRRLAPIEDIRRDRGRQRPKQTSFPPHRPHHLGC